MPPFFIWGNVRFVSEPEKDRRLNFRQRFTLGKVPGSGPISGGPANA